MPRVSVVLPSRNERFLNATVQDVLTKAAGDVEVVVVLDGAPPVAPLPDDPRVRVLAWETSQGLRAAVNAGIDLAAGEFVMKLDAHCRLEDGWDDVLCASCDDDWLVIPRRVSLDAEHWCVAQTGRPPVDYEYIANPLRDLTQATRPGNVWRARARERAHLVLDDDMSFQGSCYFLRRAYWQRLGPLVSEGWGPFVLEPEELGNKVWLSGGRVVVNKGTQYAHLHKGQQYGRGFFLDRRLMVRGREHHARFFLSNAWLPQWPTQVHPYEWLIDHFWPVPTWTETWREDVRAYLGSVSASGAAAGEMAAGPDEQLA